MVEKMMYMKQRVDMADITSGVVCERFSTSLTTGKTAVIPSNMKKEKPIIYQ